MDNEKFQELVLQQLQDLAAGQKQLTDGQKDICKDLTKLETSMGSLEKGQLRLETRMENEVIDKIRALFDTWQVHEDKLDDISTDTRYLVARVAKLEKTAR